MRGGSEPQRLFGWLLTLWWVATSACAAQPYNDKISPSTPDQHADGLLVKFKSNIDPQHARLLAESYGAREVLSLSSFKQESANQSMTQWRLLKFDRNADLQQIMPRMKQDARIETVELNEVVTIQNSH